MLVRQASKANANIPHHQITGPSIFPAIPCLLSDPFEYNSVISNVANPCQPGSYRIEAIIQNARLDPGSNPVFPDYSHNYGEEALEGAQQTGLFKTPV